MGEVKSLWGEEFSIDNVSAEVILSKLSSSKKVSIEKAVKSKSTSISEKLILIENEVNRILGKYKQDTVVIKTKEDLVAYIDCAVSNGIVAVDTETNNSLDPFTCKLMGPCLYTPGQKNAYIPINHVDLNTGERLSWQLTEQDIKEQFDRLKDTKVVMHNYHFDYEVLYCTCGCSMNIYWDTKVGANLLNENESAKLKDQYRNKIDPNQEKYDIDHLFSGVEYAVVPPELFALYAATDSFITYKLYEYQKAIFEESGNERLYSLFLDVEVPVLRVLAEMEIRGVSVDLEYSERLRNKYHKKLKEIDVELSEELKRLSPQIEAWKLSKDAQERTVAKNGKVSKKTKLEQLDNPISLTSTTQLAILLYDILSAPVVDSKSPRSTDEDALEALSDTFNICRLLIEQRTILKLIQAFIDSLPENISKRDGKIHASFNSLGAKTGRMSCSNPNMQQIPSKNSEIRMLFTSSEGNTLVGADFSQQEPRLLAAYSGDDRMINSYKEDKDLYAVMGQAVYHNNYEDNLEHYPDGSKFEEGTKRRKAMKTVLLGIMYGMGTSKLSNSIHVSKEEAQEIINSFYDGFSGVSNWINDGKKSAKTNGYVEDFWGRRRRLNDALLPEWEAIDNSFSGFNPLLGITVKRRSKKAEEYLERLKSIKSKKDEYSILSDAKKDNITVISHSAEIGRALRQCVNARIQGSAATMTKKAMILLHNDDELKSLGFHLLLSVHDELIGECPIENADKAAERLSYLMSHCVPEVKVPFKCDAEVEKSWYKNVYDQKIQKEYKQLCEKMSGEDAFKVLYNNHEEQTEQYLLDLVGEGK